MVRFKMHACTSRDVIVHWIKW